jgi:hypothetical protein
MAFMSKKKNKKDDVLELTDVVEEGGEQQDSVAPEESFSDADLESELNDLFGEEDVPSDQAPQGEVQDEDDDLDLDSLFQELDQANAEDDVQGAAADGDEDTGDGTDDQLDELLGELGLDEEPEDEAASSAQEDTEEPVAQSSESEKVQAEEQPDEEPRIEELGEELQPEEESAEESPAAAGSAHLEERLLALESDVNDKPGRDEVHSQLESLLEARLSQQAEASQGVKELEQRLADLEKTMESRPTKEELETGIESLVEARLQSAEFLETLQSRLFPQMEEELNRLVDEKIKALESEKESQDLATTQDIQDLKAEIEDVSSRSVTPETLESMAGQLKEELSEHIAKAVPGAAAQIIREEIQALSQELGESDS